MVSKSNFKELDRKMAHTLPHYGLRKLSIGVASVLLSTTLYAGVTAQADTATQSLSSSSSPQTTSPATNQTAENASTNNQTVTTSVAPSTSPQQNGNETDSTVTNTNNTTKASGDSEKPVAQPRVRAAMLAPVANGQTAPQEGGFITGREHVADPNPHDATAIDLSKWSKGLPSSDFAKYKTVVNGKQGEISIQLNLTATPLKDLRDGDREAIGVFEDDYSLKHKPLWNAVIDNQHTYSFLNGSVSTSTGVDSLYPAFVFNSWYHRTDELGNIELARLFSNPNGLQLTLVEKVTTDGLVEHLFYFTNTGTKKLPAIAGHLDIDTMLDDNDRIPIISDGHGGAYIKGGITLWLQPMYGVEEFAAKYDVNDGSNNGFIDETAMSYYTGGRVAKDGVDTAITYHFKNAAVDPGQTKVYGFRESIFPDGMDPVKNGTVRASYLDQNGNEIAQGDLRFYEVGKDYTTQAKEIKGYKLTAQPTNATGKVTFGNTQVSYIYAKANAKVTIKYVDDDKDGAQVGSAKELTGAAGEKVTTGITAPTHYTIVGSAPAQYTLLDNTTQTITVHLKHQTQATNDQKQVTRTVNYTDPTTKQTKSVTTQTASLQRTGTKDLVTNETKWNDWNTAQWAKVDAPKVTGYRVTNPEAAAAMTVTSGTSNTTVTFTYVSDHQESSVVYVDDDKGGAQVKTVPLSGNTGDTVKTNIAAPSGYVLSGTYPSEYTFKQSGNAGITVHLKHAKQTVNDQKTVTRAIKYTDPKTGATKDVTTQSITLKRTGTKDLVTNQTQWNDWQGGTFAEVNAPAIAGYAATPAKVASQAVTGTTTNSTVTIKYQANNQTTTINYIDDTTHKVVKSTTVTGKTDQKVALTYASPDATKYTIAAGQNLPKEYTFKASGNDAINVRLSHVIKPYTAGTAKTITRTVNYVDPATQQTKLVTKQVANLSRTGQQDMATGQVTYGKWTQGAWQAVTAPTITGYQVKNPNAAGTMVVTDTQADQTVVFTYDPVSHKFVVKYVDQNDPTKVIHTQTLTGKTAETIKVADETPAGWYIVNGQALPSQVALSPTGHADIVVPISHRHTMVTADQPKTTADKLPHNPTVTFPVGVDYDYLNRTVTREIKVVPPHGEKQTIKQTVKLTRNADVDEVTKAIQYTAWQNGQWAAYQVPKVDGYLPTLTEVPAQLVTGEAKDQAITITYSANAHSMVISFVDHADPSHVLTKQTVNGDTDQTVQIIPAMPAGWHAIAGTAVPTTITFGPAGADDLTIPIEHSHVLVTPDQPKTTKDALPDNLQYQFPVGVGENDLNQSITRTIKITDPRSHAITEVPQIAHLMRSADVDEVTGKITYNPWTTAEWASYAAPEIAGYTPSQAKVDQVTVTEKTPAAEVNIVYTANDQTMKIEYVDAAGQVVHTQTLNGHTDETLPVTNEVPVAWQLSTGQTLPAEITFGPTGHANFKVVIEHMHVKVTPDQPKTTGEMLPDNPTVAYPAGVGQADLNKTIMRTINVTDPKTQQVSTTTQPIHLTRSADIDEVTGEVTYTDWTTGTWEAFTVPEIPGYTANRTNVLAVPVDHTTQDQTITISYTADNHTTNIEYVNADGNLIATTMVLGLTGQTVDVPEEIPAGWKLAAGMVVPKTITFGADGHKNITLTIEHQHVTVTADDPKTTADQLPDNPSKNFPSGVTETDLVKVITRTIKVHNPLTNKTDEVKQTAKLTRTADVDEVTGEVTYSDWSKDNWPAYPAPTFDGYQPSLEQVPSQSVTANDQDQTVEIDYQKVAEEPKESLAQPQPTVINQPTQTSPAGAPSGAPQQSELPQTGDENTTALIMAGLAITSAQLALLGIRKKQRN